MSYLICFGIVVAAGCVLTFVSSSFAYTVSRVVEAGFEFAEYRLALRARERQTMRAGAQAANAAAVVPFGGGEVLVLPRNKRSTQQLGVARVAA
jgi:hypothetical protein